MMKNVMISDITECVQIIKANVYKNVYNKCVQKNF